MDDKKNYELFNGKTLGNIFEDIYKNCNNTKTQISGLINQLKPFVKTTDSALIIVPLIKEYIEISVRNDEHLIKLTEVVQRMLKERISGEGGMLTEDELHQLWESVDDLDKKEKKDNEYKQKVDEKMKEVEKDIEELTK